MEKKTITAKSQFGDMFDVEIIDITHCKIRISGTGERFGWNVLHIAQLDDVMKTDLYEQKLIGRGCFNTNYLDFV